MSIEIQTRHTSNDLNGHKSNKNGTNKVHSLTGAKLEETFQAATEAIQNLPKNGSFQPSNELLLKFYAYFKQSTIGPCNIPRPSIFKVVERAKWDSWNSVKNLSKEEAMNLYIDEIKNIVETMPHNDTVQKFLEILGPIYDNENEPNENGQIKDDDKEEKIELILSEQKQNQEIKLNGHLTHSKIEANNIQSESDDEDYCDTSDTIQDTTQLVKALKSKLNNGPFTNGYDDNDNHEVYRNGHNGYDYTNGTNGNNDQNIILNQFGGESNTNQPGLYAGQSSVRPSRPSSNQQFQRTSNAGFNPNMSRIPGTNGSGDGGYPQPPNDSYLAANYDANRQILLLLMRLQQDTNNVLTRLSYLEATVMSIQNSIQMNRIESTIQATSQIATNQIQPQTSGYSSIFIWKHFLSKIDWRTLLIAIIGPIVIRLVFLVLKKFKFIIKYRRSNR